MNREFSCPKCGRPVKELHHSLCEECYAESLTLVKHPEIITIKVCSTCTAYRIGKKWTNTEKETDLNKIVRNIIKEKIKIHEDAENPRIMLKLERLDRSTCTVHIHADATVYNNQIACHNKLVARIKRETCNACSRLAGGYYEAIIQLRGDNRIPTDEEINQYIEKICKLTENIHEKGDRTAFITKTIKRKEGTDFYLGSNKAARQITQKITTEDGTTFTRSPKLVGRKDGKDIYRTTYALRLPEFKKGDIINQQNNTLQIIQAGKTVRTINLKDGTKKTVNKREMKNTRKIAETKDAKTAIVISSEKNTIQILDPENYRTHTIKKPPFVSNDEKEVKILEIRSEIVIIR